jgi:hypothetical protein
VSFFTQRFHPFGAWCSSAPAGTAASHDEPAAEARGGYISNGAFTTHPAQLPKLLRQAFTGRDARVRLERFLRAIEYPSLGQAAKYLGLHQGTLTQQVQGLERACGGQLLHRQPAPRPIGPLTPLGHKLCQQARDHLNLTPTP